MIGGRHLRLAGRAVRHALSAVHPYEVQAVLLNACDLKCVYCRCPEFPVRTMTTDEWRRTIRGLSACGTLRIKFQGGEPTLRPDFPLLCAEAKAAGLTTAVISHGGRIARSPALLDGLDEAVITLDARTPSLHDRQRGPGTHAAAVRALDLSLERGLKTYAVMIVTKLTFGEVEPLLDFCEARGIRFHAQPVYFGRRYFDESVRPLALSQEQIRALHVALASWKRRGRPLMFSASTYGRAAGWPDYDRLAAPSDGPSRCMAGRFYFHIEPNGDVWPCAHHIPLPAYGNVLRDGLVGALRSAKRHHCADCYSAYLIERKRLFGLQAGAWLEMARRG